MGFSVPHLLLLLIIIFVVFGVGKLPKVMGDLGKGIRSLREGLKGEGEETVQQQASVAPQPTIVSPSNDKPL
jgi:sec-independent protein translocase protein TatA